MSSLNVLDLFSVKGMVFVITGGGSGLGAIMAQALAANGASKVFILGRRQSSLEAVAASAKQGGGSIIPIPCDVSSKDSLQAAATAIKDQTPFINVLIANAGILGPVTAVGQRPAETTLADLQCQLWAISDKDNSAVLETNVSGAFYTFLAFVELLDAGNKHPDSIGSKGFVPSQFISTSSCGGFSRQENISHLYSTSKAALVHLTKMVSTTFAPYGIRANSIAPGLFITEMTEFVAQGADLTVPGCFPKQAIPSGRAGRPEDIAGAVLYLTSPAGGYVNGNILIVDGGSLSLSPGTY